MKIYIEDRRDNHVDFVVTADAPEPGDDILVIRIACANPSGKFVWTWEHAAHVEPADYGKEVPAWCLDARILQILEETF